MAFVAYPDYDLALADGYAVVYCTGYKYGEVNEHNPCPGEVEEYGEIGYDTSFDETNVGGCYGTNTTDVTTSSDNAPASDVTASSDEAADGGHSTNLPRAPFDWYSCWQQGLDYDESTGCCVQPASPIIIDVSGNGFDLTDNPNGVFFDLNRDGTPEQLAWTSVNSDDAWLVLDRNANGMIDSGAELFGNYTPQPAPPAGIQKNGFNALAVYDLTINGGNADGKISQQDAVFAELRLWQDTNHNGVSESTELFTLPALGVVSLDLDYKESKRTDEHGNRFLYRAKVRDARGADVGKRAWDVFLVRPR